MSRKSSFASIILSMTYGELSNMAADMVAMQNGAKEDGWAWKINETYGEFGMLQFLHSWAEGQGQGED